MKNYKNTGIVERFPGKSGWYYVLLSKKLSEDFRRVVRAKWPALLGASFTVKDTTWDSSIMPIKGGGLFIALPAKVRKAESVEIGQKITINFKTRP